MKIQIEFPSDNEGFTLLQCPFCGDFFKLNPSNMQDDKILQIHCPYCGQSNDSFFTKEIIDLSMTMTKNLAINQIYGVFESLEQQTHKKQLSFKADKKPKYEYAKTIFNTLDELSKKKYECCKLEAKIKPIMKIAGTYCPFCGVKNFEIN